MTQPRVEVPCGICRQCCFHDHVFLHPELGDDPDSYRTVEVHDAGAFMVRKALAKRQDGACVYLGAAGCTIRETAPAICRAFDCKAVYQRLAALVDRAQLERLVLKSPGLAVGKRRAEGGRA